MAIAFQKNQNIKYSINSSFIQKAEQHTPKLKRELISAKKLVTFDPGVEGITAGMKDSSINIEEINSLELGKGQSIIIDFGKHCVGNFEIEIMSNGSPMDAPLHLELHFAEVATEFRETLDSYKGVLSSSWLQVERVHFDTLPVRHKFERRYSFRYVLLKVLDTSPKYTVSFKKPRVLTQTSASTKNYQNLNSKSKMLNKIDKISMLTLQNCMQTVFEDGPKRDQRLWLGDLRLQAMVNYEIFKDIDIVKRCLYLFGGMTTEEGRIPANVFVNPRAIPDNTFLYDYHLFFISALYDYYQFSKDKEVLTDLYPVAKKALLVADKQINNQNIVSLDESWPVFIDWSKEFDKQAATNGIYLYAANQFIELAKLVNDMNAVTKYQNKVRLVSTACRNTFYDERLKLFTSGSNEEINLASQVWLVLADILSQEEKKQVMTQAVAKLFPIKKIYTPYMYHHVTEALFVAGLLEEGVNLIETYWGGMVEAGADTFWEAYNPDDPIYSPYQSMAINSYCHAWSCTPSYLLRKYCLENI